MFNIDVLILTYHLNYVTSLIYENFCIKFRYFFSKYIKKHFVIPLEVVINYFDTFIVNFLNQITSSRLKCTAVGSFQFVSNKREEYFIVCLRNLIQLEALEARLHELAFLREPRVGGNF